MIGCNCGPLTNYEAEFVESLNSWVKLNEQWFQAYLSWCQLYYPVTYMYNQTK